ncbi:MAG: CAP domain-containing protein, partial [Paracoccaceae bacterium]|nr:CAP domain-containing protein [Paracoccaceae bacterium]
FCLALPLAPAAFACSLTTPPGASAEAPDGAGLNQPLLDRLILSEVNYARCQQGRPPLTSAPLLRQAGLSHSRWMVQSGIFSHDGGPHGLATLEERINSTGIPYHLAAENIATVHQFRLDNVRVVPGKGTCEFHDMQGHLIARQTYASLAHTVVTNWMNSPGHRANLLNPQLREVGTGTAYKTDGAFCGLYFFTQDFAG